MSAYCTFWFFWSACVKDGLTFGSLGEWFTVLVAIAALLTAIHAGKQARRSADSSHKALLADIKVREEAQARLVYSDSPAIKPVERGRTLWEPEGSSADSKTTWPTELLSTRTRGRDKSLNDGWFRKTTGDAIRASVTVRNLSPEIITDVYLFFVNPHLDGSVESISAQKHISEIIKPQGEATHTIVIPYLSSRALHEEDAASDFMLGWDRVIEFRDSSGVWWRRLGVEPIQKLKRESRRPPEIIDWASFEMGY